MNSIIAVTVGHTSSNISVICASNNLLGVKNKVVLVLYKPVLNLLLADNTFAMLFPIIGFMLSIECSPLEIHISNYINCKFVQRFIMYKIIMQVIANIHK